MAGFVYVMSSPELPKLSKIGKSLAVPCRHGLTEQNTTDAPSAFECAYYINVENYDCSYLAEGLDVKDLETREI